MSSSFLARRPGVRGPASLQRTARGVNASRLHPVSPIIRPGGLFVFTRGDPVRGP